MYGVYEFGAFVWFTSELKSKVLKFVPASPPASSWQPWSACSAGCATLQPNGTISHPVRRRSKVILRFGNDLGKNCDDFNYDEEEPCNMMPCPGAFAFICTYTFFVNYLSMYILSV
jgi:hypothetical protein